jgi:hypothetical protein
VRGPGGDGGGAGLESWEVAAEDPAEAEDGANDPGTIGDPVPRGDGGVEAGVATEDEHVGDAGGLATWRCMGAKHEVRPCSILGESASGSERAEECSSESSSILAPVWPLCVRILVYESEGIGSPF